MKTTYYLLGSVVGPHPYPVMVRDFQSVIGREVRAEFKKRGRLPDAIVACVGGGSNSMGSFHAFVRDKRVRLIGVEAGGTGAGKNAASLIEGRKGVLHGMLTYVLQDENGQVRSTESISAGLDYPGVGPEHSFLKDSGRATYVTVSDDEAVEAFHLVSQKEGIIPALESAHAVAYAVKLAKEMKRTQNIVVTLSGRGDKDVHTIAQKAGFEL